MKKRRRSYCCPGGETTLPPDAGWASYFAALLAAGVYVNSLAGEFVHDDVSAITANRDVIDPSAGAWDFLFNDFWGSAMSDPASHKSYRPFTIFTFK